MFTMHSTVNFEILFTYSYSSSKVNSSLATKFDISDQFSILSHLFCSSLSSIRAVLFI